MAIVLATVCAIYVILCSHLVLAEENCFVVAPNVFRVGTSETFAVMVDGGPKTVTVTLHTSRSSPTSFFHWSSTVSTGSPQMVDIIVRQTDVTNLQHERNSVMLKVKCGSLWTKSTPILMSPASGEHFFLQTEKPIYRPGESVNVRFLAVDGRLKPSKSIFRLEVRNPQNLIVERTEFQPQRDLLLTHTYQLPERTLLGEWSLLMKHGYNFEQNTTSKFLVDKYVLPRFKVDLSIPDYVLSNFSTLPCSVAASFVNKKPVEGVVRFTFGLQEEVGGVQWFSSSYSSMLLEDGKATYNLLREQHKLPFVYRWDTLFDSHTRLVVKATVTEEATGAKESAQSNKTVFSRTPYVISLAKNQQSFKPGLKIYIIVELTYLNGNPARDVPMKILLPSGKAEEATTGSDGVVTFFIPTSNNDDMLSIEVATNDPRYSYAHQARERLDLEPYESVASGFIGIQRKDPKSVVKANELYEAALFTNRVDKITSSVYYAVLSKGRVQQVKKLHIGKRIEENIVIRVTPEMTPSFRVVAFAVLDGHVVTDSIYVNVEPACTHTSHVTLERKNSGPSEPMALETLVVTGTPGTAVSLLGVDQALYVLRKKDLLTRKMLFQSLDSKDLGCGAGGGVNAAEALSRAGVVLLTRNNVSNTPRSDNACYEPRRRRRETLDTIMDEYEDETLRWCCSLGSRLDWQQRECTLKVRTLMDMVTATPIRKDCVDAFRRCCQLTEDIYNRYNPAVAPRFIFNLYESSVVGEDANYDIWRPHEFTDELSVDDTPVREGFPDTWLFHSTEIGTNGRAEIPASLPSSITTWEVNAVSVSPSGGVCATNPLEILAMKKFYVEVNVPYSVVKNEQINIPATVYNYGHKQVEARMVLLGTNDICSGAKLGKPSAVQKLSIPPGRGRTAIFPVVPLSAGVRHIHVRASSSNGESDAVKVELNVRPPGITKTRSFAVILDPQNSQERRQEDVHDSYTAIYNSDGTQVIDITWPRPDHILPNTEHCQIDIVGDGVGAILETVVKHPEEAVILPSDCGEQATSKLLPALYAYGYFNTTKRISISENSNALAFFKKAYSTILQYRKSDGSFSIFTRLPSTLWLTAYVIRTLCQATKVIMVDEAVITSGLSYIARKQGENGEFTDGERRWHSRLVGDLDHPTALTAYMLITLQECDDNGFKASASSKQRAASFVERHVRQGDSPGGLALAAYALSLAKSPGRQNVIQWLEESVHHDQGERHVPGHSDVYSAQATSYAIMTFIKERKDVGYVTSFVQWLSKRISPSGSLKTSKDTVMALQALAKYATYTKDNRLDLSCEVTVSDNRDFKEHVRIKRDNATILNKIETTTPDHRNSSILFQINEPGEKILINVKGSGSGILFFNYTYNVKVPDDICKFDITANFEQKQASGGEILTANSRSIENGNLHQEKNPTPDYLMKVCASPNEDTPDGMVIFEVGLLTGFKANVTDLENLVNDGKIDSFAVSSRKVDIYVRSIPRNTRRCVHFSLEQEFNVGQLQSSYVKVYTYYEPDFSCERLYTADKSSPLLKFHCDQKDVCICAEGGCPPADPLNQFLKNKNNEFLQDTEQQDLLREFACDDVDYVWKGKAKKNVSRDGFIEVTFLITQVLKPGASVSAVPVECPQRISGFVVKSSQRNVTVRLLNFVIVFQSI
ncbi:A.superbus venom factor 1 isoform X4 [Rhipicephalus microplus]|uniref:A.superbus venom factor 1 isoform X4 n=1 Tax=Rhipicephalus microplus TaxID=6941 RepID=UPI003F6BF0FD